MESERGVGGVTQLRATEPDPPRGDAHEDVEEGPRGTEYPTGGIPAGLDEIRIPLTHAGGSGGTADYGDSKGGKEK